MNDLILKGKMNVEGMQFNHIEGGFGKDKKAMLVKDIAEIHDRQVKFINQNINRNRERFKDGIDIIDLKNGNFKQPLEKLGFTNRDVIISNNIYLLSERGYSKLLKILEDDFAWEQYEKLVDGYFNIRQALKEKETPIQIDSKLMYQLAQTLEEKEKQIALQGQIIGELKPRADYTDRILKNKGLVTITQIAKDYGMSGESMNRLLHRLKVQYKQSGQWLLYANYQGKGYTHSETIDIVRSDGTPDIKMNTKWTQKGRLFLYELLKANDVLPDIEKIA